MNWIYLSPHYDDAVLSCGGLIRDQVNRGDNVEVWTIFGGDPPAEELSLFAQVLHYRWGIPLESVEVRRSEDLNALRILGASAKHFDFQDCIYRKNFESDEFLYEDMEKITDGGDIGEPLLMKNIEERMSVLKKTDAQVVAPFSVGDHADHRIIRIISDKFRIDIKYYLDFPYVFMGESREKNQNYENYSFSNYKISGESLSSWKLAVAEYKSQISSFWENNMEMDKAIKGYYKKHGGIKLFSQL